MERKGINYTHRGATKTWGVLQKPGSKINSFWRHLFVEDLHSLEVLEYARIFTKQPKF
jgi:hypothetical protein